MSQRAANLLNALCSFAVLAVIVLSMIFAEPVLRAFAPAFITLAMLADAYTLFLAIRWNYSRRGPSGLPVIPLLVYAMFVQYVKPGTIPFIKAGTAARWGAFLGLMAYHAFCQFAGPLLHRRIVWVAGTFQ